MSKRKLSFFERLTGGINLDEIAEHEDHFDEAESNNIAIQSSDDLEAWEEEVGELSIDMYQTSEEIVIQTMAAGVRPEDLDIEISRDMVTIEGKRKESRRVDEDDYVMQELYWGSFSRTVILPEEIDPDLAEASEKHGLLIIKLPKIDKNRKTNLKIKSS